MKPRKQVTVKKPVKVCSVTLHIDKETKEIKPRLTVFSN